MITNQILEIDMTKDIWYGDGTADATLSCTGDGIVLLSAICTVETICLSDLSNPS